MNFTSSCLLLGSLKFFYPSACFTCVIILQMLKQPFLNWMCKVCVSVNDACLSQLYKPWVSKDALMSVSPVGVQLKCLMCLSCPPFSHSPNKQWGTGALGVRQSHDNLPLWFPEKIAVGRNIYAIKKKRVERKWCLVSASWWPGCVMCVSLHFPFIVWQHSYFADMDTDPESLVVTH